MINRTKVTLIVAALVLFASIAIGGFEKPDKDRAVLDSKLMGNIELFAETLNILRSEYAEEVDSKKLIYGALRGMLESLDDYSSFLDPDEYEEIKTDVKGEFGGIGIEITLRDGVLTIITPMAGTPAEEAGIAPGDKIVEIDGKITRDITLNESMKRLRGKPGTSVTLTVWREKEQKILKIKIDRAIIKIKSIKNATLLEDKIGYVKLVEFQENAPRELEDALKKLEAQGMDALLLDLRNNPGGVLEVSVNVAEKFLTKGAKIVSVRGRDPQQNKVFTSTGKFTHPDYPVIVITNEGSASASEIVAGAIQDNKRGILVGTKTFGKASVQAVVPLKDNSAIRFTVAYYLTPNGRMIKDQGITPDVIVENTEPEKKTSGDPEDVFKKVEVAIKEQPERDDQLQAALNLIKAIKIYKKI